MKTTLKKMLFTSMLLSVAGSSILFSAEESIPRVAKLAYVRVIRQNCALPEDTPLLKALGKNRFNQAERLIRMNADVNDGGSSKPLMVAASRDNPEIVKLLVESNADLNFQNDGRATAIMFAIQGSLETAKILVQSNADLNIKDSFGGTALAMAILQISDRGKMLAMVALLTGVDVESKDEIVASLTRAVRSRQIDEYTKKAAMDKLFGEKRTTATRRDSVPTSLNDYNSDGNTELLSLVRGGNLRGISRLLERRADINYPDRDGIRPLTFAAFDGCPETVRLLLENKADASATDKKGNGPLGLAVEHGGCEEIVKLLLEHKADIKAVNRKGFRSLTVAIEHGHEKFVKLLLEHKANADATDRNIKNRKKYRPLTLAVNSGYEEVVKLLLEYKADINYEDGLPLRLAGKRLAKDKNDSGIMKLFRGHMAGSSDVEQEK